MDSMERLSDFLQELLEFQKDVLKRGPQGRGDEGGWQRCGRSLKSSPGTCPAILSALMFPNG